MGTFHDSISEHYKEWIMKQKIFFVASAPLDPKGHVNVSPKGYECFRVIHPNKVCYLEFTGSGIETLSHLKENGRLTIMFAAFQGGPRILRLWSFAEAHVVGTPEYESLLREYYSDSDLINKRGLRSIIVANVYKVGSSCGFGVPFFDYKEPRNTLVSLWGKRTDDDVHNYWVAHNCNSLDGLDGLQVGKDSHIATVRKRVARLWLAKNRIDIMVAFIVGVIVTLLAGKYSMHY